ncbi:MULTISPECIES: hypothetical protein [unclassified Acinetobacter]|uniref:hypothetical protein n=1 Tax=unclassified Acinetobacter TaxID=196816 RepID=UPI0035B7980A
MKLPKLSLPKMNWKIQGYHFEQSSKMIDYLELLCIVLLICGSVVYFFQTLKHPITVQQQQAIENYSNNTLYPQTQVYAKALKAEAAVNQYQYLKMMQKVHIEHRDIRFKTH